MLLGDAIALRELSVERFEAGSFDIVRDGNVHIKTCPYTILAQAVQGRYAIDCGNGRKADLAEGEAFLTGANLPLRITHHGDPQEGLRMRARWLHLHFTLFGSVDVTSLLALPLRVGVASCQSFGELIEAVFREPKGAVGVAALAALARRQELAFRALRLLCELAPLRDDAPELLRQRHRLGPVLELMRERLSEPVCVAELARRAGLSVPQFHAFFRRFMGRTPMEHLRQLRLSEACRLLVTADEPLRNVAEKTGFCNEFHLSREFRRVFGRPPGRWRREHDRTMG